MNEKAEGRVSTESQT